MRTTYFLTPLSDLALFSLGGAEGVKQRVCAGTLCPAGYASGADRIAATVGRCPAPEPIAGAGTISGDRNRRSDRRTSTARNTRISSRTPQNAPQGFTWYGIPCSEQNAAGELESTAERKPGTVAADRAGLHTTAISSCDNMTVRGHKRTLKYIMIYAIMQSQGEESRTATHARH